MEPYTEKCAGIQYSIVSSPTWILYLHVFFSFTANLRGISVHQFCLSLSHNVCTGKVVRSLLRFFNQCQPIPGEWSRDKDSSVSSRDQACHCRGRERGSAWAVCFLEHHKCRSDPASIYIQWWPGLWRDRRDYCAASWNSIWSGKTSLYRPTHNLCLWRTSSQASIDLPRQRVVDPSSRNEGIWPPS
jgi:hypothetical protein